MGTPSVRVETVPKWDVGTVVFGKDGLRFIRELDFETKIVVKHEAPTLFRDFLARDSWNPDPIVFSGVTDCFQPPCSGQRRLS